MVPGTWYLSTARAGVYVSTTHDGGHLTHRHLRALIWMQYVCTRNNRQRAPYSKHSLARFLRTLTFLPFRSGAPVFLFSAHTSSRTLSFPAPAPGGSGLWYPPLPPPTGPPPTVDAATMAAEGAPPAPVPSCLESLRSSWTMDARSFSRVALLRKDFLALLALLPVLPLPLRRVFSTNP